MSSALFAPPPPFFLFFFFFDLDVAPTCTSQISSKTPLPPRGATSARSLQAPPGLDAHAPVWFIGSEVAGADMMCGMQLSFLCKGETGTRQEERMSGFQGSIRQCLDLARRVPMNVCFDPRGKLLWRTSLATLRPIFSSPHADSPRCTKLQT